ncbi:MAG: hypothetical protein WC149_05965 [Arcobacteraceae bacterium]
MTDYELITEITGVTGEEAIDTMINNSSNSNKKDLFKSTFSTTDLAKECNQIDTANQLNYLLRNMKLLLPNGYLSENTIKSKLAIIFKGKNKQGEEYSQIRWTTKGRDYILKNINQNELSENIKIVDDVELRYTHPNNDLTEYVDAYIILCKVKNEENNIYKLNQKINYSNIAEELIEKIIKKGSINTKYWTCYTDEELQKSEIIYWSDSDFSDMDDDYYDDSEEGETQRMINEVSNQLGYDVDEGLARSFIHDMSK